MFCFISSTDSWFDYPPRKNPALLALLGAGLVLQVLYLPYQVKRQMQD